MVDDFCVWKPPGGLREDFFHAMTIVFIYNPQLKFLEEKFYDSPLIFISAVILIICCSPLQDKNVNLECINSFTYKIVLISLLHSTCFKYSNIVIK